MNEIYLSVVIPAYRESKRISATLLSLEDYFIGKEYAYEIIVVNDGSPDDTAGIVRNLMPKVRNLRLIDNAENRGKGYAVKCGMNEAQGAYRLFMDADNSVSIGTVESFFQEIESGYDVVIGSISLAGSEVTEHNGWHRRLLGSLSKGLIRALAVPGIRDTQRGFKLFTAEAANLIFAKQTIERFGFDIELLAIAMANDIPVKEIPVAWNNPAGSTVTSSDYFKTLTELLRIIGKKTLGIYAMPAPAALGWFGTATNEQLVRFGAIGVANTVIDLGLYAFLTRNSVIFENRVLLAKTCTFIITSIFSFFANRIWTFQKSSHIRFPEIARFYLTVGIGFAVNLATVAILVTILHVYDIAAVIAATLVAFAWNFTGSKLWVFNGGSEKMKERNSDAAFGRREPLPRPL